MLPHPHPHPIIDVTAPHHRCYPTPSPMLPHPIIDVTPSPMLPHPIIDVTPPHHRCYPTPSPMLPHPITDVTPPRTQSPDPQNVFLHFKTFCNKSENQSAMLVHKFLGEKFIVCISPPPHPANCLIHPWDIVVI